MPASSSPPSPEPRASALSSTDRRALTRFVEQSLDHGFRLAIIEAANSADRETILDEIAALIGPGLLRIAVDELPGAEANLWQALKDRVAAQAPRCLALWGVESRTQPDWLRQLNVQRDLFVRDLEMPWLLFIHPATRVPLMQTAPDFCDFAILWIRDERPVPESVQSRDIKTSSSLPLPSSSLVSGSPLLQQAQAALFAARFDEARDHLFRFDLQSQSSLPDRLQRQLLGARIERDQGHLALAEALLRETQNTLAQLPQTAENQAFSQRSNFELGTVLHQSGSYAEAEALLRHSLAVEENVLGVEHPDYGATLHALAGVLKSQGKYAESEAMLRRALAIDEKALGTEHPNYAMSLHALAGMLKSQGKYAESEALLRRTLALQMKVLSAEHPNYGATLYALAGALKLQGKFAEAEALLRRSLAISEKALSPEHPNYGATLHALAGVLESQGKYAESEVLLRQALAIAEKALGPKHHDYGATLYGLASVLSQQGKYAEAETLLHSALAIVEKALGPEHHDYGATLYGLASVLSQQGKYAEAEALLRRALAIAEKALGPEHPSLCPVLTNLAGILVADGKVAPASELALRALSIAESALGQVNPAFGQILLVLAQVQARQQSPEAAKTAQQGLMILEQCLGAEHPLMDSARSLYASLISGRVSP